MKCVCGVRTVCVLAAISLLISCCGCGIRFEPTDETESSLWIVTNNSGMKQLIDRVSECFLEAHPGMTITIDTGPDDADEWPVYLEQLQVQIMAGEGPDIFLFLSENISSSSLITDVNQFMRNGLFLDIAEYYDRDTEVNKDGLVPAVMDAGVVDGARYVLPLRYNFPVVYADVGQLEAAGISVDDLKNGLSGLVDAVEKMGEDSLAADYGSFYFYLYWMNVLPELIDYEKQSVLLDKEELVEFLAEYRALMACGISDSVPNFDSYIEREVFWALDGYGLYLGTLNCLAENTRIAKSADVELAVIPLTASDGSLIANVSYYGAVSANTHSPELAYAFLREFLLEENQWENNLGALTSTLIDSGWPVLVEGAWADLDKDLLKGTNDISPDAEDARTRRRVLKSTEMVEEDYLILDAQIDTVRFFPAEQWDYMMRIDSVLNINRNPNAMEVDLEVLAEEIIQELEWRLAEG